LKLFLIRSGFLTGSVIDHNYESRKNEFAVEFSQFDRCIGGIVAAARPGAYSDEIFEVGHMRCVAGFAC